MYSTLVFIITCALFSLGASRNVFEGGFPSFLRNLPAEKLKEFLEIVHDDDLTRVQARMKMDEWASKQSETVQVSRFGRSSAQKAVFEAASHFYSGFASNCLKCV